ncbi:hypothetical protein BH10BAC2_BH10BAC2_18330 [soil metagenome]
MAFFMFFAVQTMCMKLMLWIFLLAGFTSSAQSYTLDTLPGATAYVNSFSLLPFYGTTGNGDYYAAGFNEYYDEKGKAQEVEFVRIDLTTRKVQYKRLPKVMSGNGFYWIYIFDKNGNVYLSMNTANRKLIKLNLKDSIAFTDLGNAFPNGTTLAYSASLGQNGHLYFGGSSGGTYWSEYDPAKKSFQKHPAVDVENDYVLSIAGDEDYVYLQTGQRKNIQLWAVNKSTEEKKLLFTVPNTTRISLSTYSDGIYAGISVDTLVGTFKLIKGNAVKNAKIPATGHDEISGMYEPASGKRQLIKTAYDAAAGQLNFSIGGKAYEPVTIRSNYTISAIRRVFSFPNDKNNIYYAGDYYGNYYRYNLKEKKAYLLGSTGYNIYSSFALNDSMIYLSGYPSGFIMLWNKNKPWTTNKLINGKTVDVKDANANPKMLHYWKSEGAPAAGFHHTYQMLKDNKGNLIGAGDVIRIGNAASIGVYNAATDKIYGIDYSSYTGFNFAGIALWNDLIVYSMKSKGKKKPKLYFYDPVRNSMVDSIDAGFENYGKIFIQKGVLTGVAENRIYSIALKGKKLLWNYTFNNPVNGSYMLHDGRFVVNTTSKLPPELKQFIALPVASYHEANNVLYAISGKNIVRVNIK